MTCAVESDVDNPQQRGCPAAQVEILKKTGRVRPTMELGPEWLAARLQSGYHRPPRRQPRAMFRDDVSWNGATLAERLAHLQSHAAGRVQAHGECDGSSPSRDDLLIPWARACALGDREALLRRLSWDAIDVQVARAAMAAEAPRDFPVAPWVGRFSDFV